MYVCMCITCVSVEQPLTVSYYNIHYLPTYLSMNSLSRSVSSWSWRHSCWVSFKPASDWSRRNRSCEFSCKMSKNLKRICQTLCNTSERIVPQEHIHDKSKVYFFGLELFPSSCSDPLLWYHPTSQFFSFPRGLFPFILHQLYLSEVHHALQSLSAPIPLSAGRIIESNKYS